MFANHNERLKPKLPLLTVFYVRTLMVRYDFVFLGYINNMLLQGLIKSISFQRQVNNEVIDTYSQKMTPELPRSICCKTVCCWIIFRNKRLNEYIQQMYGYLHVKFSTKALTLQQYLAFKVKCEKVWNDRDKTAGIAFSLSCAHPYITI